MESGPLRLGVVPGAVASVVGHLKVVEGRMKRDK